MAGTRTRPVSWAGKTPEQRREERRGRLLDAALDAFGTEGYASSSINRICKRARVTERDLYREFGGKAGLFTAVYDRLIAEVFEAVRQALDAAPTDPAARVRAAIGAFTTTLAADPRKVRVNFVEAVGAEPCIEAHRREVLRAFGDLVAREWQELARQGALPRGPRPGLAMALVGATQELLLDWVGAPAGRTLEEVVDALVRVYLAVMHHA